MGNLISIGISVIVAAWIFGLVLSIVVMVLGRVIGWLRYSR